MKKTLVMLLALAMLLGLTGVALAYPQGEFEGTAQGFGGEIKAVVTLGEDAITNIVVTGDAETPGLGGAAIDSLPAIMLEKQDVDIDAFTGATITSDAIEEAIADALKKANLTPDDIVPAQVEEAEKKDQTLTADVVIVGAGGAGMTAAITAKQAGKSVVVLEKMPYVGGNTTKATGGMNAAETSVQKTLEVTDTVQTFIDDTMKGGKNVNDPKLVGKMAADSAAAIDWLASIGAPLPELTVSGGATNKRMHRPEGGVAVGPYLVEKLSAYLEKEQVPVLLNTRASEIIMKDGKAVGVKAEGPDGMVTVEAKAVVLTTGGFGANLELCAEYNPALKGFVTTNSPSATGDGIKMAQAAGAALVDIDQIQIHPTVHQATAIMITESVRGGGALLVNQKGERFINELETRDVVSQAEIGQEGGYAYLVFDQLQRDNLKAIESYVKNGLTVQAETLAELAKLINVPAETLEATVTAWNKAVADKADSAFGRTTGMDVDISKAPFYAIQIAPGIHHTMGGVAIDPETHVLNADGAVIPGLFAAGEVTGGVHGANRIGGNAVADIIVFGRQAGESAAKYAGE